MYCAQVSHRFLKCRVIRYRLVFPPNPDEQTLGPHFFTVSLAGHSKLCLWWNQWGNAPLWLIVIWISHLNYGERVTLLLPYLGSKKDCNTAQTTWRCMTIIDHPKKTKSYILDQRLEERNWSLSLICKALEMNASPGTAVCFRNSQWHVHKFFP